MILAESLQAHREGKENNASCKQEICRQTSHNSFQSTGNTNQADNERNVTIEINAARTFLISKNRIIDKAEICPED